MKKNFWHFPFSENKASDFCDLVGSAPGDHGRGSVKVSEI
jgi:hypothetical protein